MKKPEILDPEIEALGLEVISTGGGFEAWYLENDKYHILLTNDETDMAKGMTENDLLGLGYYKAGQVEPIEYVEGEWPRIKEAINSFKDGSWLAAMKAAHKRKPQTGGPGM